jgi:heat shock protein HslJ
MPGRIVIGSLLLLVLILLAGCSSTVPPEDLTEGGWVLVSYIDEKGTLESVPPTIMATATFDRDGRFSGHAGCNDYFGTYQVDGGLITFGQLGSTETYCLTPEGIMDFEQQYLSLLSETTRYNIDGDEMTLSHYDERKLLVFRKS